mgnify:CR=1 FL=1
MTQKKTQQKTEKNRSHLRLIPQPLAVTPHGGDGFVLGSNTVIVDEGGPKIHPYCEVASSELSAMIGSPIPVIDSLDDLGEHSPIRFIVSDHPSIPRGKEAYVLTVSAAEVLVLARKPRGIFRGLTTLLQLVQVSDDGTAHLDPVIVEDAPRYKWRGLSLDVARSFLPVAEVKQVIDLLARYKMNVLHLHLSDDQGWRLEVPSRPSLTEAAGTTAVDGGRWGHYTVEDYADLVQYAAARGIEIVPEFDTPGHVNAATHAYGELNANGKPSPPFSGQKVGFSKLDPAVAETEPFLEDVFTDLAAITPGRYLHIGGDEALEMTPKEYETLVRSVVDKVRAQGKEAVAWQEAVELDPPVDATIQFWSPSNNRDAIARATNHGVRIIMSPADRVYLDMKYDSDTPLGLDWAGHTELQDSYDWDPDQQIESMRPGSVTGVEAAVWTETIHDLDALMYMLLPRLPAIAEVAWSPQGNRDFSDFSERIADEPKWWGSRDWTWHRSPGVDWEE